MSNAALPRIEAEGFAFGREPQGVTLSVVIPALDEESSIAEIIARTKAVEPELRKIGVARMEIIVVDDGSKDRTAVIVRALPGVALLQHARTRGYGAALKTGFSNAQGDLLAFLDADGTYPPEHLPELCAAALEQGADVVVGSRRSGGRSQMPLLRRVGNLLWSNLVSIVGGTRCVDPASGMRVLRRTALPRIYPLPDGLNFTPVMSTRAVHEKLKVVEIPIPYAERSGRSKLTIVGDGTRFLKTILWTSMEYNPAKVLGLLGVGMVSIGFLIGLGLVVMRALGVTTVGPWGAFSVFAALVFSVAGISVYSLGITFSGLASLFHSQPVQQGLFPTSFVERRLESHFGWLGLCSIAIGVVLASISLLHGGQGWEIGRVWLWLLGSGLFVLMGFQLLISWILTRILSELRQRNTRVDEALRGVDVPMAPTQEPGMPAVVLNNRSLQIGAGGEL